jgi:hypothetical protein
MEREWDQVPQQQTHVTVDQLVAAEVNKAGSFAHFGPWLRCESEESWTAATLAANSA